MKPYRPNKRMFTEAETKDILCSYEMRESMSSIGRRYGVSHNCIKRFLREANKFDENRRTTVYDINHDAFKSSDLEQVFYWAGFIAADGCVTERTDRDKRLTVLLHDQDVDVLHKLNAFLQTNKPIYKYKNKTHSSICISSLGIVEDLKKFNITERKTSTMKVPDFVPGSKHERHYWRGVVDGDGTLGFGKYSPYLGVVGTQDVCRKFSQFCAGLDGFKSSMKVAERPEKGLFSTMVLSRHTLLALDELYRDASVFMDRKMMTYLRIKEEFDAKVWVKNYSLGET